MRSKTAMKQREYEPASAEIIRFETETVLTESATGGSSASVPGIDLPLDPFVPPTP